MKNKKVKKKKSKKKSENVLEKNKKQQRSVGGKLIINLEGTVVSWGMCLEHTSITIKPMCGYIISSAVIFGHRCKDIFQQYDIYFKIHRVM